MGGGGILVEKKQGFLEGFLQLFNIILNELEMEKSVERENLQICENIYSK